MAEDSFPWDGTTVGDHGQYAAGQWDNWWEILFTNDMADTLGVLKGVLSDLNMTVTAANTVTVQPGCAIVKGKWYRNTANVDLTISTPVATRIDRIVLQSDWTTQTIRLAVLAGTPGGAAATLTQTDGTLWELLLWEASITAGGAITLTDYRGFARISGEVLTADVDISSPSNYIFPEWRQGRHSTEWEPTASDGDGTMRSWTVGAIEAQIIAVQLTSASQVVTFPTAFSTAPHVYVALKNNGVNSKTYAAPGIPGTANVMIYTNTFGEAWVNTDAWILAIGPS